jgi:peptidoglycan/LPS O-acetylase OafA/YrhL
MGNTGPKPERRNDIDWLRILAVLLLIPFHTARIFDIFDPFYVKNAELSPWLSYLVVALLEMWQMPLLFLLAGASTWYALRRRSGGQYVGERLKRLLVPFLFGTLVIVPPQMYFALLHRSNAPASYLEFYAQFFQIRPFDIPDYTGIGFTWAHLWFILYLFVISLIALPLFLGLKTGTGGRITAELGAFLERGPAIFLLALPLPFVFFYLPVVFDKDFFMYLLVFIYGFVLMTHAGYQRALDRNKWLALGLALVCTAIRETVLVSGLQFAEDSPEGILLLFVGSFNLWCWLVALLGLGHKYLNADNRALRYARDASYPFYILHQTVIVVIGFFVVGWTAAVLPKYLVIAACSLVVCIALYDLVIRRTNVTRFLLGMKPMPRGVAPRVVTP